MVHTKLVGSPIQILFDSGTPNTVSIHLMTVLIDTGSSAHLNDLRIFTALFKKQELHTTG